MACLVSFTFLLPLSASNVIYKEMHSKNLVLGRVRVSGQPSYRTVICKIGLNNWSSGLESLRLSFGQSLTTWER
ncbi:hypothetical protein CsatB_029644 [Cannabis sativa]